MKCNTCWITFSHAHKVYVTQCSHLVCYDCASKYFSKSSHCPICDTNLEPNDIASIDLSPTVEKIKTLCGLDPSFILQIASRAIDFYNFQQELASKHDSQELENLKYQLQHANQQHSLVVKDMNSQISSLTSQLQSQIQEKNAQNRVLSNLQQKVATLNKTPLPPSPSQKNQSLKNISLDQYFSDQSTLSSLQKSQCWKDNSSNNTSISSGSESNHRSTHGELGQFMRKPAMMTSPVLSTHEFNDLSQENGNQLSHPKPSKIPANVTSIMSTIQNNNHLNYMQSSPSDHGHTRNPWQLNPVPTERLSMNQNGIEQRGSAGNGTISDSERPPLISKSHNSHSIQPNTNKRTIGFPTASPRKEDRFGLAGQTSNKPRPFDSNVLDRSNDCSLSSACSTPSTTPTSSPSTTPLSSKNSSTLRRSAFSSRPFSVKNMYPSIHVPSGNGFSSSTHGLQRPATPLLHRLSGLNSHHHSALFGTV